MMTLQQAARFFDDQTFTNVYDTSSTFSGQILPFSDSVRSGSSTRRRILDISSDVSISSEYIIQEDNGQVYIVAAGNEDYFLGNVIRVKHPVVPTNTTYAVRTIAQVLAGSGGLTGIYVTPSYIRRMVLEERSDYDGIFSLYLSPYYSVSAGHIITDGSKYYRARESSRLDDIGFTVAEAVEVTDPISSVTVQRYSTVFNATTDAYPALTPLTGISVFTEAIVLDFQHEALGYAELEPGDKSITMLKTDVSSINVGDWVGSYKVLAVSNLTGVWTIHGRI